MTTGRRTLSVNPLQGPSPPLRPQGTCSTRSRRGSKCTLEERYRESARRDEVRRQAVALARIALDPKALALFEALDEREWRSMKELCEKTGLPYGNTAYIGGYRRLLHDASPLLIDAPPNIGGPQTFQRTEFCTMFLTAIREEQARARAMPR